uniref:Uncharacterized protein n=1 Tax=Setaria viridis TaxID=4556 RepID=A0A4U6VS75_SETVI|nr:hypothetical protein SEVIR_2G185700v2 [Setaria viridis]
MASRHDSRLMTHEYLGAGIFSGSVGSVTSHCSMLTACLMEGRRLQSGWAHTSPTTITRSISTRSKSPPIRSSAASTTAPLPYRPQTHSRRRALPRFSWSSGTTGGRPQAISRSTTPKLYTSDSEPARPATRHSGSM